MAIYERIEDVPRRKYRVKSPVTFEPIGEFESATDEDVRATVERARKAQAGWAELTVKERAATMWRLLDQFVKR
ncbi:MAG: aldehyde dehydrogenase family protein, partial [Myxococcota bacterium]